MSPRFRTNRLQRPKEGPSESEYYSEALAAFKNGDYQNAVRLAGHATLEQPRNQKTHLLLMLGLFAAGQYRPGSDGGPRGGGPGRNA